jgi:hypothetical protein
VNVEPNGDNPSPELVLTLVREARNNASGQTGLRTFSLDQEREQAEIKEKQKILDQQDLASFFGSFTDNATGYPGYSETADSVCFAIMKDAGVTATPADIMVMPGNAGMSLQTGVKGEGEGNGAVVLMTDDKVRNFRTIAMKAYGPQSTGTGTMPCYRGLLDRIQLGTILISESLMSDEFTLKGTIWHECGHKYLNDKNETGAVFARELSLMKDAFGKAGARRWIMEVGRKPGYHRTYGLRTDPGRKDLLLLLQEVCTSEEFYLEFGKQYLEIIGQALDKPDSLVKADQLKAEKQQLSQISRMSVQVGTQLKGTLKELKSQLEGHDLNSLRGSVRPGDASAGDEVTFAGRTWRLLNKTSSFPAVFELECLNLDDGLGVTPRGTVWARTEDASTMYGLVKEGPWPYTDMAVAQRDQEIVTRVVEMTMAKFDKADRPTVFKLAMEQVLRTREDQ